MAPTKSPTLHPQSLETLHKPAAQVGMNRMAKSVLPKVKDGSSSMGPLKLVLC